MRQTLEEKINNIRELIDILIDHLLDCDDPEHEKFLTKEIVKNNNLLLALEGSLKNRLSQ